MAQVAVITMLDFTALGSLKKQHVAAARALAGPLPGPKIVFPPEIAKGAYKVTLSTKEAAAALGTSGGDCAGSEDRRLVFVPCALRVCQTCFLRFAGVDRNP